MTAFGNHFRPGSRRQSLRLGHPFARLRLAAMAATGLLTLVGAACSDSGGSGEILAPAAGASGTGATGGGSGSAGQGGQGGSSGSSGGAVAGGGASSGGSSGTAGGGQSGSGGAGSGGSAGAGGSGIPGAAGSMAGGSGGSGGSGEMGMCPSSLPALAADGNTAFYANRMNIPHGRIQTVQYKAGSNKTMRVYTPPDYESNTSATYPVLYLNHGGGENDSHWGCTTGYNCGYAGWILDNLLADGKAVPMLIAMPNTGDCANFTPPSPPKYEDPCTTQYMNDFIPYMEENYRAKADRHYRAIAGLSMGGLVTMNTGFAQLDTFSHVFIYSSGYLADTRPQWETNLSAVLGDSEGTNALLNAPIYVAAGNTDTALENARAVHAIFEKNGIEVFWQQSSLGHEWGNWRRYLAQTLPLMFKNTSGCD